MDKIWILLMAVLIFLVVAFLFWKLVGVDAKKEYGTKMWNHWPTRLYYWQALVLYSTGITILIMLLLNWLNVIKL